MDTSTDDAESLGLLQKILLATDGTVTELLGLYTGETIRVRKIEQSIVHGGAPAMLDCAVDAALLRRRILLAGAERNYLYADSLFVVERLPASIRTPLLETDQPIGRLWKAAKLESYREIIERRLEPGAEAAGYFGLAPGSMFVSRTYLIHHAGRPMGAITEKWPRASAWNGGAPAGAG